MIQTNKFTDQFSTPFNVIPYTHSRPFNLRGHFGVRVLNRIKLNNVISGVFCRYREKTFLKLYDPIYTILYTYILCYTPTISTSIATAKTAKTILLW